MRFGEISQQVRIPVVRVLGGVNTTVQLNEAQAAME